MDFRDWAGPQITLDEPLVLVAGLYVRDACGFEQRAAPADLPPLVPAVVPEQAPLPLGPERQASAAAQWNEWWERSLPTGGEVSLMNPENLSVPGALDLTAVLRHFGADALQWALRRHREHADAMVAGTFDHVIPLIHNLERDLGRRPRAFTLRVTELPVAGQRSWRVEPDHLVVSRALLEHPVHFVTMIEPVLEALA
jgi:hypothetical protein